MEKLLAKAEALDFSTDSDDEAWLFIFSILLFLLNFLFFLNFFIGFVLQEYKAPSDRWYFEQKKLLFVCFNLLYIKELSF